MSQQIELTVDNSIDFLKRYVNQGYQSTGSMSIKDGAIVSKWFRILKGVENDAELKPDLIYKQILQLIENFNSSKAYNLDDAAVLDRLITFVNDNQLKSAPEPKIKEL